VYVLLLSRIGSPVNKRTWQPLRYFPERSPAEDISQDITAILEKELLKYQVSATYSLKDISYLLNALQTLTLSY